MYNENAAFYSMHGRRDFIISSFTEQKILVPYTGFRNNLTKKETRFTSKSSII